jgi:hypothetical protein
MRVAMPRLAITLDGVVVMLGRNRSWTSQANFQRETTGLYLGGCTESPLSMKAHTGGVP